MPDITEAMDSIIKYTNSHDYTFSNDSNRRLDSFEIRLSIIRYIQRILGIDQSEDYDYSLVNKILPIDLKVYIKKITCYP